MGPPKPLNPNPRTPVPAASGSQWGLVDGDVSKVTMKLNKVKSLPTIRAFSRGTMLSEFSGDRTAVAILEWAKEVAEAHAGKT